ncbi:unnamed protein product [Arctia plantaginis]|uniref:Uncharacterized protein n=1 Tax=Arctia plantaginis TaxID=874455 RepID=A0A8S1ARI7_ARCPL|nr:unnamed protein product [Arctia plantaginis]CAB3247548.1 unnamed protein product [Arctia plantaginis]
MGAKQSKRSVDISGKEAESAGEVAASIAGGEGRLEPLADADALKPQLNGDAHIHDTEEKQKDVDSGTPENEKDATTEKETKQQEEDKEAAPLTNGESEQKVENGESTPTPEDGKKPKKEKVKKKWSLRSISFSRKDKPKQEKKPKDEEPKLNGEPEKVPEETADVASEVPVVPETAEEVKTATDIKEDKTPETPVTEPITNGSSTPESPKAETPVVEEAAAPSPVIERPQSKTEVEPEQLPVNGLSIAEPTEKTTEIVKNEDIKEASTAETTEPVPEISVKKEVCVEQMPLIDSTPPPLPANPPPSSVASFAATTMAPELSDASLANTADNATLPPALPPSDPVVKDKVYEIDSKPKDSATVAQSDSNELSPPVEKVSEVTSHPVTENGIENNTKETIILTTVPVECNKLTVDNVKSENELIEKLLVEKAKVSPDPEMLSYPPKINEVEISSCNVIKELLNDTEEMSTKLLPELPAPALELIEKSEIQKEHISPEKLCQHSEMDVTSPSEFTKVTEIDKEMDQVTVTLVETVIEEKLENSESEMPSPPSEDFVVSDDTDEKNTDEDLPDPPPPLNEDDFLLVKSSVSAKSETTLDKTEIVVNSDNIPDSEETYSKREHIKANEISITKSTDSATENLCEVVECNGNSEFEPAEAVSQISAKESSEAKPDITNLKSDITVTSPGEWTAVGDADESLPTPPRELCAPAPPQELPPVSDKLADLISEVPEVPELKTEPETTSGDAAVAN